MAKEPTQADAHSSKNELTRSGSNGSTSKLRPQIGSGIKELDKILGGGYPQSRLFLIEGDPGTGKTTLALQFLLEGTRCGESGVYVTFSESEDELRAVAESHGWSLDGIHLLELNSLGEKLSPEEQYTVFQPAEVELNQTTQRIIDEVQRLKPQRVVVDSLSEIRLVARDGLRYRRQILALKQILSDCGCTILFLEDHTLGNTDLLLQSIAHGVLLLQRQQTENGGVRRKLQVLKVRGVSYLEGSHDFVIRSGGLCVFPRLVASKSRPLPEKVGSAGALATGSPALDQLLGGGVPWGSGALLVGPAGTGKSTLGAQLVLAAAKSGHKVMVCLFEEAEAIYLARSASLGLDLRGFIRSGAIKIERLDTADASPGEFANHVCRQVDAGVRVVVIDSLNGYLTAMNSERVLIAQLHELLAYLHSHSVITIFTTAQHGIVSVSETTPFELTYLADLVVLMRYFEAAGSVRRAISIIKNRLAKHERTIREFDITPSGIVVGEPLREFQGILTGVPDFKGPLGDLMHPEQKEKGELEKRDAAS